MPSTASSNTDPKTTSESGYAVWVNLACPDCDTNYATVIDEQAELRRAKISGIRLRAIAKKKLPQQWYDELPDETDLD
jgi:hypothetical protein